MAIIRMGLLGSYYGDEQNSSSSLSTTQMKMNADYIYSYFSNLGWTINAISALLANMQSESSINPGRWESDDVGDTSQGYGLVQWTPATKYINWLLPGSDYSTMDNNLSRIKYEYDNNIQWIRTSRYNISFREFSISTASPEDLAYAFMYNYERPADKDQPGRKRNARYWYEYLGGSPIPPSSNIKKNKFKWVLFHKKFY